MFTLLFFILTFVITLTIISISQLHLFNDNNTLVVLHIVMNACELQYVDDDNIVVYL